MNRFARMNFPFALIGIALFIYGCTQQQETVSIAKAEKPKNESELAYVTISKKANKSLQIETASIHTDMVQELTELTGWIMIPQGAEVTMTSPVAGYVRQSKELGASPVEGQRTTKDQELFRIEPVLSPVEQIQIANLKRAVAAELAKAKTSLQVAKKGFDRIKGLHKQGLRSQQDLEKAQEQFKHADEDLQAAQDKTKLFIQESALIKAPLSGAILKVHVSAGQFVPASAALITIADLRRLWVRVPVPEFDVTAVNATLPVRVSANGRRTAGAKPNKTHHSLHTAKPVAMVPTVDTLRHTVDMIYELPPDLVSQGPLVKDQMVTVFIPMGQKNKQSVVPYAAIVYDAHGGAWVYLDRTKKASQKHLYERRRVQVGPVINGNVAIIPTLGNKERVVTKGAGVLFSREFYSPPVR